MILHLQYLFIGKKYPMHPSCPMYLFCFSYISVHETKGIMKFTLEDYLHLYLCEKYLEYFLLSWNAKKSSNTIISNLIRMQRILLKIQSNREM